MRHAVISMPAAVDQHERRLGVVDEHLVSLLDPTSFAADQYRTIRHVVEGMHPTKKLIAVTSAVAGDGKTTTAINLAGALAHAADARILLWDLDLRTPSMEKRLGLDERTPGFADMILNPDLTLDDMIWQHPRFRLSILPAGRSRRSRTSSWSRRGWWSSFTRRGSGTTTLCWIPLRWRRFRIPG
jgi:Mrp family chromosome partitioning ATPase